MSSPHSFTILPFTLRPMIPRDMSVEARRVNARSRLTYNSLPGMDWNARSSRAGQQTRVCSYSRTSSMATNENTRVPCTIAGRCPPNTVWSERNQTQRSTLCMSPFRRSSKLGEETRGRGAQQRSRVALTAERGTERAESTAPSHVANLKKKCFRRPCVHRRFFGFNSLRDCGSPRPTSP